MFSVGEAVVLLAVGSWAFGPKELPRIGRALGKLTGRATGFIYKARAQLFDFAEKAELTKVQQELQMTMQQLQAIRSELQGGINILDPGPLSRQILGGGLRSSSIPSSGGGHTSSSTTSVGGVDGNKSHLKLDSQQNNLPFAASGATGQAATNLTSMKSSLSSLHDAVQSSSVSPLHHNTPFEVLPISAAAAGLVPDRSQSMPTASEILADALQEEKVAHQALQFFQQQVVHTTSSTSEISSTNGTNSSDSTSSTNSVKEKKTRKPRSKKKNNPPS